MKCCCSIDDKSNPLRDYIHENGNTIGNVRYWVLGLKIMPHFWSDEEETARKVHNMLIEAIAYRLPEIPSKYLCDQLAMWHHRIQKMRNLSCHRLHLWQWLQSIKVSM